MSALLVALSVSLSAAGCATTHPENPSLDSFPRGVVGSTDVTYYDVHGTTPRELVADMRRLGPKTADGGVFFGETHSPLRWTWRTHVDGAVCSVTSAEVYVRSEIRMPRWTPPSDAPAELVAEWNQFIAALETHEIGHKDISARGARDVLTALRRVSTGCSFVSTDAKRVTDGIMARLRVEQQAYDASTRHGATQGATFPPRRVRAAPAPAPAPASPGDG
jgi:predicted secreted Zn-dependent protease